MSRAALLLVVPLMLACSKKEAPAVDTTAVAPPPPAAPAPVSYAGKWSMTTMPQDKDTVLVSYTMDAADNKEGWKLNLPNRPVMNGRVLSLDNDSVVIENGPYESVLRKGVQVTTHTVFHMEGDKLVGTTTAHYKSKGADSVRVLRVSGTKM